MTSDEFYAIYDEMEDVLSDSLNSFQEDDIAGGTDADLGEMTYDEGSADIAGPIAGASWQVACADDWWYRRFEKLFGRELEGVQPKKWISDELHSWHDEDGDLDVEIAEVEAEFVLALAKEWTPVAPAINAWLRTIHKYCIRFFEKHPGAHPKMTYETYSARRQDRTAIWRPPVHDSEKRVRESRKRFEAVQRKLVVAYRAGGKDVPAFVEKYAEYV